MLIQISKKNEVELPGDVLEQLCIMPGEYLECVVKQNTICLVAKEKNIKNVKCTKKLIKISCFQCFQIFYNEKPFIMSNKKAEELLAYLICEKALVKKSAIAEILWPEVSQERAKDCLYKVCTYIRKIKDSGIDIPIYIERDKIYLERDKIDCDIYRFEELCQEQSDVETLERVAELYKGSLLYENYYEWTMQSASYYEMRYYDVIMQLIQYYKSSGNLSCAIYYEELLR